MVNKRCVWCVLAAVLFFSQPLHGQVNITNVTKTSVIGTGYYLLGINSANQTRLFLTDPLVQTARTIGTSSPLSGGGDLSGNLTLSIANAAADGSTKGAAGFTASDFDSSSGIISLDYANGQAASSSQKGFLTAADWTTFNSKLGSTRNINTTSPLSGGGDLSADRTLSIGNAAADGTTKGAAAFLASDFDASAGIISLDYANGQKATTSVPGFLSSADFTAHDGRISSLITNFNSQAIVGDFNVTNLTGNVTLPGFTSLRNDRWNTVIWKIDAGGGDRTVSDPPNVWTDDGSGSFIVTNGTISLCTYGVMQGVFTNRSRRTYYPH